MEFRIRTNEGSYDLEAFVMFMGKDLLVAIQGGDTPHIGAVSMAQSRPSLKDPERVSSTASVFCFTGHKEDDLAKAVAEILSAVLDSHVVVAAGIHWDDIDSEGIEKAIENTRILIDLILEKIGSMGSTVSSEKI